MRVAIKSQGREQRQRPQMRSGAQRRSIFASASALVSAAEQGALDFNGKNRVAKRATPVVPGGLNPLSTTMEMIMSPMVSTPVAVGDRARSPGGVIATVKRLWIAYRRRRNERAAIIQLYAMSDRELRDIGLTRSEIAGAVRGERDQGRSPALLTSPRPSLPARGSGSGAIDQ